MLSRKISRSKVLIFSIFLLIILIAVIAGLILFLDKPKQTIDNTYTRNYKNFQNQIKQITDQDTLKNNLDIDAAQDKITLLSNPQVPEKERYEALAAATFRLSSAYSSTNEPVLKKLINETINNYARDNYPYLYNENDFYVTCQDKTCQTTAAPPELDEIIIKINKSDFPDKVKETLVEDLINTSYKSENKIDGKATQYIMLADMVEQNDWFSPSNQNVEIAEDIYNLVKKYYPDDYEGIIQSINISKQNQK